MAAPGSLGYPERGPLQCDGPPRVRSCCIWSPSLSSECRSVYTVGPSMPSVLDAAQIVTQNKVKFISFHFSSTFGLLITASARCPEDVFM